ncbi:MAG: hypothetical protein Q9202_004341 [Teloschistes flavicans]
MPFREKRAIVTQAKTAPAYWQIGNLWRVMVTGVQSENSFTLLDQIVTDGGGGGPCTHTHTQDEGLYVVSGQCTFNAGGKDGMIATAGTFVNVPRLTQHSFTVEAPNTQLLNFYLPAGFEQLLTGIAHPADRSEPPPPDVPLAPAWLIEKLAEDYGQTAILGMPFKDPADADNMKTEPTPGATLFPYAVKAEQAQSYRYQGGFHSLLASGDQTGGVYCLIEQTLPQGIVTDPHIDRVADEVWYVLKGRCTFLLDDKVESVEGEGMVFIPKGVVKALRIDSLMAKVLCLHTPSGYERLVSALGQQVDDHGYLITTAAPSVEETLVKEVGVQRLAVANPLQQC